MVPLVLQTLRSVLLSKFCRNFAILDKYFFTVLDLMDLRAIAVIYTAQVGKLYDRKYFVGDSSDSAPVDKMDLTGTSCLLIFDFAGRSHCTLLHNVALRLEISS